MKDQLFQAWLDVIHEWERETSWARSEGHVMVVFSSQAKREFQSALRAASDMARREILARLRKRRG